MAAKDIKAVFARGVRQQVMRELLYKAGVYYGKVEHEIVGTDFNLFRTDLWKVVRVEYPTRPDPRNLTARAFRRA